MYIEIDEDTGHCSEDGPFRSYELIASGSSPQELAENAYIVEVDQDGGYHECRDLGDYSDEVYRTCMIIIAKAWLDAEMSQEGVA